MQNGPVFTRHSTHYHSHKTDRKSTRCKAHIGRRMKIFLHAPPVFPSCAYRKSNLRLKKNKSSPYKYDILQWYCGVHTFENTTSTKVSQFIVTKKYLTAIIYNNRGISSLWKRCLDVFYTLRHLSLSSAVVIPLLLHPRRLHVPNRGFGKQQKWSNHSCSLPFCGTQIVAAESGSGLV